MVKGKHKTIKSVAKRVSLSGTGLVRYANLMRKHKMLNRNVCRDRMTVASDNMDRKVKSMLGMSLKRRTR
jgi:ribosomal protein L35